MVYNALYKMVSFKRHAANDEIGVLSSLRNDKLVLNQDEKQTYTLTTDTVFVRVYNENNVKDSNLIRIKNVTNPDYYLGSLVRIIYNDNKEVTHIVELGNPEDRALGIQSASNDTIWSTDRNDRWEGVAKYTVETGLTTGIKNANEYDKYLGANGYVTIQTKEEKTDVKTITFHKAKDTDKLVLNVNDDTKVYVANPLNNQMRKVEDINAALALIGYQNYNGGYKIPNVYAGYDAPDDKPAYALAARNNENYAKVVVFNTVNKAKSGEKYRIVNEANYKGGVTLQRTNGKLEDANFINSLSRFPYNYNDLYDVIELSSDKLIDSNSKLLDHSDYTAHPVVRVIELNEEPKTMLVEDGYGQKVRLNYSDADVFVAGELKVGSVLQFTVGKDTKSKVEIVSILPNDEFVEEGRGQVRGNLYNIFKEESLSNKAVIGKILNIVDDRVTLEVYEQELGNKTRLLGTRTFLVGTDLKAALETAKKHDKEVVFEVEKTDRNEFYRMANVRINDSKDLYVTEYASLQKAYDDYVDKVAVLTAEAEFVQDNAATINKNIKDAVDAKLNTLAFPLNLTTKVNYGEVKTTNKAGDVIDSTVEFTVNAPYDAPKNVTVKTTLTAPTTTPTTGGTTTTETPAAN